MRVLHRIAVSALALFFVFPFAAAADAAAKTASESTVVVLVRHAEKQLDVGDDPALTEAGAERASLLVHMLGTLPIDAIYSTDLKRTRATIRPLAEALGIEPTLVEPNAEHIDHIVSSIRSDHAGGTVVISGHSNTVPVLIERLGVADPPKIEDYDYDNLFVVVLSGDDARLVHLQFGGPTP